jgi:hypothetical protein
MRHDDHFQVYKERCGKLGISMHERAIPKSHGIDRTSVHFGTHVSYTNNNSSSLTQTTLDGAIPTRPRVPQFTTAGALDYVVELVVCEDEVRLFIQ